MRTITCKALAGRDVWRGTALLRFGQDGVCLGVARRARIPDEAQPTETQALTQDDIEACVKVGWVAVLDEPGDQPLQGDAKQTGDNPSPTPPTQTKARRRRRTSAPKE